MTISGTESVPHTSLDALRALCLADPLFTRRYEGWEALGYGDNAGLIHTRLRATGRDVALKIYWHAATLAADDPRGEAMALMDVTHPSVVRVYGVFADHTPLAWIELERVDGVTLGHCLRQRRAEGSGPWPLDQVLAIGACLAEGLAAVHAAGFVHRDLKPDNVLLPRDGRPAAKLADFGVARALDATRLLYETLPGNAKYASPEAVRGERVGGEADVYALGLMLYEIVSGGLFPYPLDARTTAFEVLESHRRRVPLPLRTLGLGVPDGLVDLIHAMLDKQPERRPSATTVASRLRALERAPVVPVTRHRTTSTWLALGVGVVLALALALVGMVGLVWLVTA